MDFKSALVQVAPNLQLRKAQFDVLSHIYLTEQDSIVCLPTGYGKSIVYQLCAPLLRCKKGRTTGSALVISPLNIIQKDQELAVRKLGLTACRLNISGQSSALSDAADDEEDLECDTDAEIADIISGQYDVILCHPEALFCSVVGRQLLDSDTFQDNVLVVAIDECHTSDLWSADFRRAFGQLHTLPTFFPVPVVALSATLPTTMMEKLPDLLGMKNPRIFRVNPDKPNIYLDRVKKIPNIDIAACAESVYMPFVDELLQNMENFPVTLLYMPIPWCSEAMSYAMEVFKKPDLYTTAFGCLFSQQDEEVVRYTMAELKKDKPQIRLVFCTSSVGMGFDSPAITRVIHGRPPRNLVDYLQQIGRAGRKGQESTALLYYNSQDIATNLDGIEDSLIDYCKTNGCLRVALLDHFGFTGPVMPTPKGKCCINCSLKSIAAVSN